MAYNPSVRLPAAAARIHTKGGFAFPADVSKAIGVSNVVRNGAGNYTVTITEALGFYVPTLVPEATQPLAAAPFGASLKQLTGTTFELTTNSGAAQGDIGNVYFALDLVAEYP